MLHIYAALAEQERRMISERTRQALAAARERGVVLENAKQALANKNKFSSVERQLLIDTGSGRAESHVQLAAKIGEQLLDLAAGYVDIVGGPPNHTHNLVCRKMNNGMGMGGGLDPGCGGHGRPPSICRRPAGAVVTLTVTLTLLRWARCLHVSEQNRELDRCGW